MLKNIHERGKQRIQPTFTITRDRLARKDSVRYIKEYLSSKVGNPGENCLCDDGKTYISSKLTGIDFKFSSKMVVEAIQDTKVSDGKGGHKYPNKASKVLESYGKSAREFAFVKGYESNGTSTDRQVSGSIVGARMVCWDFSRQLR